jgi:hypothetical protein
LQAAMRELNGYSPPAGADFMDGRGTLTREEGKKLVAEYQRAAFTELDEETRREMSDREL